MDRVIYSAIGEFPDESRSRVRALLQSFDEALAANRSVAEKLRSALQPPRGRRLVVALGASAVALAGVALLTVLLVRLLEGHGYRLAL